MRRGDNTLTIIFFLAAFAGLGILAIGYGPSLKRESEMKGDMEDYILRYGLLGEDEMIDALVNRAKAYSINARSESFKFQGDVGQESTLTLEYVDVLDFLFTRQERKVKIEVKVKIPERYSG